MHPVVYPLVYLRQTYLVVSTILIPFSSANLFSPSARMGAPASLHPYLPSVEFSYRFR